MYRVLYRIYPPHIKDARIKKWASNRLVGPATGCVSTSFFLLYLYILSLFIGVSCVDLYTVGASRFTTSPGFILSLLVWFSSPSYLHWLLNECISPSTSFLFFFGDDVHEIWLTCVWLEKKNRLCCHGNDCCVCVCVCGVGWRVVKVTWYLLQYRQSLPERTKERTGTCRSLAAVKNITSARSQRIPFFFLFISFFSMDKYRK